jgi:hypothetical protein
MAPRDVSLEQILLYQVASPCDYQPEAPGYHINWWTYDKLITFCRRAGFTCVFRSAYGQSTTPPLRDVSLIDSTQPQIPSMSKREKHNCSRLVSLVTAC